MDAVSELLQHRTREPGGLTQTALLSLLAHGAAIAALGLMPAPWRGSTNRPPPLVMTISLGGAPGPSQGMTMTGGRPVEAAPEPTPTPVRRPEPAAAPKQPAMILPVPDPKVGPKPAPKQGPAEVKTASRPQGAETRDGSTRTDTGAQGMGFGLSTGGGGTGGYLDVGNFCCPDYLNTMLQLIQRNWNPRQEVAGQVLMKFVIQRSGQISNVEVEQSSGYSSLDLNSQRTLIVARQFPPLPSAFPEDHLTVHLKFQYQR